MDFSCKRNKIIKTVLVLMLLLVFFLAGTHKGYDWGYADGQENANGWWIDKKSRYYESTKVRKKTIRLRHNEI